MKIQFPPAVVSALLKGRLARHLLQRRKTEMLAQAQRELREYFQGQRRKFDVVLAPGGTSFQEQVWQLVYTIPFGETCTYGDLAAALGDPKQARAVGAAVGANPIPLFIPCHRVVAGDGSLAGFAGGLERKVWLLRHEGILLA